MDRRKSDVIDRQFRNDGAVVNHSNEGCGAPAVGVSVANQSSEPTMPIIHPTFAFAFIFADPILLATTLPPSRMITIVNHTANFLQGLHLLRTTTEHWGPDSANDNVRIRRRLTVALPGPGCRWDVRAIPVNRPVNQSYHNRDIYSISVLAFDEKSKEFLIDRNPSRWN